MIATAAMPDAVRSISDSAVSASRPPDHRQTPKSRILAVLERHPDHAEQIAAQVEAAGAMLDAAHPPRDDRSFADRLKGKT